MRGNASRHRAGSIAASHTPTRKRQLSGASEPVKVLGVGAGGIVELSKHLNDRMVSWALLRFQVGGGTFLRTKLVAIHCNGEETSVMLRGWLNARSSEIFSLLGDVHANIEVTNAKELTVEYLCQRLLPVFAADNLTLSITQLNEEYGKMVAQMEEEAARRQQLAAAPPPAPKSPGPTDASEALAAVAAERGPCNWLLLEPRTLQLHSSGLGGLEELKENLVEDRVLFGVLRLSFGCSNRQGNARPVPGITKHIFVHWVGPRVSVVQRGLLNARLANAVTSVGQRCATSFRREAHCMSDLKLEDIVSELRRLTVVDGVAAADGVAAGRISAAEYLAALKEETANPTNASNAESEREAEPIAPATKPHEMEDVPSAIRKVRDPFGEWNWVLCGWDRPEPNMPPPSPCRGGA